MGGFLSELRTKVSQSLTAHKVLLESEVVILEGLKLDAVGEGEYTLCAFPLKMRDLDGSPCRAVLIQE